MEKIQRHFFEFQSFPIAARLRKKDTFLTDLISVITKIEDPSSGYTKHGEETRSKLYIQNFREKERTNFGAKKINLQRFENIMAEVRALEVDGLKCNFGITTLNIHLKSQEARSSNPKQESGDPSGGRFM